jgi:hypothetical protein
MKTSTLKTTLLSFCLGFLLSTLGASYVLRDIKLHIREARVVKHDDNAVVIMFYHDPTDQVMLVRFPVTKYESDNRNSRAVVEQVTATVWQDSDYEAWRMVSDSAYEVEKVRLFPKPEWSR